MAADYLQFLKDKFIDDFKEAPEEFDEFPLHPRFQKILEVLQARNFSPATPLALKDPLYRLKFALAECIMFAEKERERKAQDKKDHFNVHSLKKRWFLYKTKKRLLKFEAKLCKTVDNEAVESSPLGLSMITVYETPSLFEPIFRPTIYGFDDQLQKIDELLFKTPDANSINVIGIVGMGGVGKSALAHEIFYKVQSEFDLKFWIRLSEKFNPENLESKVKIIRKILEHFDSNASHASLDDLLRALHNNLVNKRYLIVLDNVWHVSDWYSDLDSPSQMDDASNYNYLSHSLPKGSGGAIIVTSRLEEVASRMVGEQNLVRLQPTLDAKACWSIFMDSIRRKEYLTCDNVSAIEKMKDDIVDTCDGLPLAAITLAEIISIRMGKREFWSNLTSKKRIVLGLRVYDYLSLSQATEKLGLLPGVEEARIYKYVFESSTAFQNVIFVEGHNNPEEIVKQLQNFGFTELFWVLG